MPDYLDVKTDILYCSKRCAKKAGAKEIRPFRQEEYDKSWEPDYGNPYGALCPVCELEYHSY